MRVLITGGAGFVGRVTIRALLERGHRIVVLDSMEPQVHGPEQQLPEEVCRLVRAGDIEFILGRVEDPTVLRPILRRVDAVIHLAAQVGVGQSTYEALRYTTGNALGAAALVEAIVGGQTSVQRVVTASSISNYGEGAGRNPRTGRRVAAVRRRRDLIAGRWTPVDPGDGLPVEVLTTTEDDLQRPSSVYGLSKHYTEEMVRLLGEATGLSVACLRYGNLYGPGQALSNPYTGVLCSFYARLRAHRSPLLFEDGRQRRRYTFVDDVARANTMALEADFAEPALLNISAEEEVSLLGLCEALGGLLGRPVSPRVLGVARVGDVRHLIPDTTRARETLGFSAQTPLAVGLARWLADAAPQEPEDRTLAALHQLHQKRLLLGELPAGLQ